MKKSLLCLIVDAILALQLGAIVGIGLLIKFVLVPGEERNILYGKGTALYFLGLERHQWGTIHLWIGVSLLAVLVLHVFLHWSRIMGLLCIVSRSLAVRVAVVMVVLFLAAAIALVPLMVKPEVKAGKSGEGQRWGQREGRGLGPSGETRP